MATTLTQKGRLVAILSTGRWLTLFEVQAECLARFECMDSETALSARFRELPPEMRLKRLRAGTRQTYEYQVLGGGL